MLSFLLLSLLASFSVQAETADGFTVARIQYGGGGDWYNGPTEIPNLLAFVQANTPVRTAREEVRVEIGDESFFAYPFAFLTGHGNIRLTDSEVSRLRTYLENGGFLFANDDYGMDESFRREIARVFPDKDLVELPPSFEIFQSPFRFPDGLPKVHEHDKGRPRAYGIFHEGRLVLLYAFESDIADGWDDPDVHGDSPAAREAALRFGANMVVWVLTH